MRLHFTDVTCWFCFRSLVGLVVLESMFSFVTVSGYYSTIVVTIYRPLLPRFNTVVVDERGRLQKTYQG